MSFKTRIYIFIPRLSVRKVKLRRIHKVKFRAEADIKLNSMQFQDL